MNGRLRLIGIAALLMVSLGAVLAADDAHDDEGDRGRTATVVPPLYLQECASCHAAYPARGLPRESWRTLMDTLDRHFGSDASLEPDLGRQIGAWLEAHAGPGAADAREPLRMTRTRWFLHEHDEIPAATWRSPEVGSAAQCGACHSSAAHGRYSEHEVQIPRLRATGASTP